MRGNDEAKDEEMNSRRRRPLIRAMVVRINLNRSTAGPTLVEIRGANAQY